MKNAEKGAPSANYRFFGNHKTEGRSSGKYFPRTDQTSFCSGVSFRMVEKIFLSSEERTFSATPERGYFSEMAGMKKAYIYLLLISLFFLGCGVHDNSPKALIEKRCYRCHTADRIHAVRKNAEGWRTTVQKMASHASGVIPEKEIPIIADYLARTQGSDGGVEKQSSGNVVERR